MEHDVRAAPPRPKRQRCSAEAGDLEVAPRPAVRMESDAATGNFFVATRPISAGEVVLRRILGRILGRIPTAACWALEPDERHRRCRGCAALCADADEETESAAPSPAPAPCAGCGQLLCCRGCRERGAPGRADDDPHAVECAVLQQLGPGVGSTVLILIRLLIGELDERDAAGGGGGGGRSKMRTLIDSLGGHADDIGTEELSHRASWTAQLVDIVEHAYSQTKPPPSDVTVAADTAAIAADAVDSTAAAAAATAELKRAALACLNVIAVNGHAIVLHEPCRDIAAVIGHSIDAELAIMNHACVPSSFLSWELTPGQPPAANLRATQVHHTV